MGTTVLVSSSHLIKKQNDQKKKAQQSEHLSRKGGTQELGSGECETAQAEEDVMAAR